MRAFRYFHLGFSLVTKGIQAITATQYESHESKKLYVEEKTGRRNPVPSEIRPLRLMKMFVRHKVEIVAVQK